MMFAGDKPIDAESYEPLVINELQWQSHFCEALLF